MQKKKILSLTPLLLSLLLAFFCPIGPTKRKTNNRISHQPTWTAKEQLTNK